MGAVDFAARYDRAQPQPASDAALAREGFRLYQARRGSRRHPQSPHARHTPAHARRAAGKVLVAFATRTTALATRNVVLAQHAPSSPSQHAPPPSWDTHCRPRATRTVGKPSCGLLSRPPRPLLLPFDGAPSRPWPRSAISPRVSLAARLSRLASLSPRASLASRLFRRASRRASLGGGQPTGTVWARALSVDDVRSFFPAGEFAGKWGGAPIAVVPRDYLVMPHPAGGEVEMSPPVEMTCCVRIWSLNNLE